MGNWFQHGVEATTSIGRRNRVEPQAQQVQQARRDSFEDIELGDMSEIFSQGRVVVALPERARVSGGRLLGAI